MAAINRGRDTISRYLLQSPTYRASDGACCGRLYGTLSKLAICPP